MATIQGDSKANYKLPPLAKKGLSSSQIESNLNKKFSKSLFIKDSDSELKINPFKISDDKLWLDLWRAEKERLAEEKKNERNRRVDKKFTFSTRDPSRLPYIRNLLKKYDMEIDKKMKNSKYNAKSAFSEVKNLRVRKLEREYTHEYIERKRALFYMEFSLQNKRNEISHFKNKAIEEEKSVGLAARRLHDDAILFDDFLKATDDAAVEAMQLAEKESRFKLEKVAEFRKLQVQFSAITASISKMDEQLAEFFRYKQFLKLVYHNFNHQGELPVVYDIWLERRENNVNLIWKKRHIKKLELAKSIQGGTRERKRSILGLTSRRGYKQHRRTPDTPGAPPSSLAFSKRMFPDEWLEEYEENLAKEFNLPAPKRSSKEKPAWLPFKEASEMLKIFHELEETNLALIYRHQQSEETLDDIRNQIKRVEKKMVTEIELLKAHLFSIQCTIKRADEKAKNYEMMCKLLKAGTSEKDSNKALSDLTARVAAVYENVIPRPVNTDGLVMLTSIENRLEELLDKIEQIPPEELEEAQKAIERKRRLQLREEKLAQQKLKQEERARKAQERAQAETFKQSGRKLMYRSYQTQDHADDSKAAEGSASTESFDYFAK